MEKIKGKEKEKLSGPGGTLKARGPLVRIQGFFPRR